MTKDEYYSRRGCEKQIVLFIILIILFLCCSKPPTYCWDCYQRKYTPSADTFLVNNYGGFGICDMTQEDIDIFESQNNYCSSTGGTDIECSIE